MTTFIKTSAGSIWKKYSLAMGLFAALTMPTISQANETAYNRLLPSTTCVRINGRVAGSGVLVDAQRRWVMTNYHVVLEDTDVEVFFPIESNGDLIMEERYYQANAGQLAISGRVINRDSSKDLAIIELSRLPAGARQIPLARSSARPGQNLHVVANQVGTGALWTYTNGKVRSLIRSKHDVRVGKDRIISVNAKIVVTSLATNPGDSGGPVSNDNGELVALVSSGNMKSRLISSCIDISEIKTFIAQTAQTPVARQSNYPPQTPITQVSGKQLVPAQNQNNALVGLWSARMTANDGVVAGFGMELFANGNFDFAVRRADGKKSDLRGDWDFSNNRLTLSIDGKVFIAGQVNLLNNNAFVLDDGVDRVTFSRVNANLQQPAPVTQQPVQQNPLPVDNGIPQQQPPAPVAGVNLAGTTWTGSENLANFGKLTFQFQANGQVTMIDTAGTSQGTWRVEGNRVTLLFANGNVAYVGSINGRTLSGSAANSQRTTWQFSVSMQ